MKSRIIILLLIINPLMLFAQQISQFSQRQLDVVEYNPSVAGAKLNHEVRFHYRQQWVGFDGAPNTKIISYSGALGRNSGISAYLISDKVGIVGKTGINLGYAYHIPFNYFNISMGLAGTVFQYTLDGNKLDLPDMNDNAVISGKIKSKWSPAFSFGGFIYTSKAYLGISATQTMKSTMVEEIDATIPSTFNYYLISGYDISNNEKYSLIPSVVISGASSEAVQIEAGVKVEYLNKIWFGGYYRHKDAISGLVGLKVFRQFYIAYSYDYLISDLNKYSDGSHEIILYFEIPYKFGQTQRLFEYGRKPRLKLNNNL